MTFETFEDLLSELSVDWHIFNPETMTFDYEDKPEKWPYCHVTVSSNGSMCGGKINPCPNHGEW